MIGLAPPSSAPVGGRVFGATRPTLAPPRPETKHTPADRLPPMGSGALVYMVRTSATSASPELPTPYRLRGLRESDAAEWSRLLAIVSPERRWTSARALRYFGAGSAMSISGAFVVQAGNELVATAQLYLDHDASGARFAELGYVAVKPEHRRQGLGTAVCRAVLDRASHIGVERVFLRTNDFRLPAIRLYRELGFRPWLPNPSARIQWDRIGRQLGERNITGRQ